MPKKHKTIPKKPKTILKKPKTIPKKSGTKRYGAGLRFQEWGIVPEKTHPEFKIFETPDLVTILGKLASAESYISRGHRKLAKHLRRSANGKGSKRGVFQIALRHLEEYELNLFRKGKWEEYKRKSKFMIMAESLRGRKFPADDIDALKQPTHIDYTNFPYVAGTLIRAGYKLSPSSKKFIKRILQSGEFANAKMSEEEFLISQGQLYLGRPIVLFKEAKL